MSGNRKSTNVVLMRRMREGQQPRSPSSKAAQIMFIHRIDTDEIGLRYGDKYFQSKMIKTVNQIADHFKCRALLLTVRDRVNGKFVSS